MNRKQIAVGLAIALATAAAASAQNSTESPKLVAESPNSPPEAAPKTLQVPVASTDMRTYWNGYLRFETADKQFRYGLRGRIHLHGTWIDEDGAIADALGPAPGDDRVSFRRVRLELDGTFFENFYFRTAYDFAGGSANFRDVYLEIQKILDNASLRVGQFREPFSLDQLNSSNDNAFIERSLVDVLTPQRTTGAMLHGSGSEGALHWAAGVFHANTNASNGNAAGDGDWSMTGRLTFAPILREKGTEVLHFGAAASYRSPDTFTRSLTRPEFDSQGAWATNDITDVKDVVLLGAEAAWISGPFAMQGEFIQAEVDRAADADRSAHGYYVQATYGLTGEGRSYRNAFIHRPKPTNPYTGPGTGSGAWELAARYSFLDLGREGVDVDTRNATIGLNWFANEVFMVHLEYVMADFDEYNAGANALAIRLQMVF